MLTVIASLLTHLLTSLTAFVALAFISLVITLFDFVIKGFFYKEIVVYDQQVIMKHQSIMITLIGVALVKAYSGQFSFLLTLALYIVSSIIVKLANIGIMKKV